MQYYFIKNREKMFKLLENDSMLVIYSGKPKHKTGDADFPFVVDRNFYYLTGLERDNMVLVMLKGESVNLDYLFIEQNDEYLSKWVGSKLSKEECNEISGVPVDRIRYIDSLDMFIQSIMGFDRRKLIQAPKYLYLDLYHQQNLKPVALEYASSIIDNYPELEIKNVCDKIYSLRQIKEEWEIQEIKKAVGYTRKAIEACMKSVTPLDNERDLHALYDYTIMVEGSNGESFDSIVGSGKNGTVLHYVANNTDLEENILCLMDVGSLSGPYASDITRVFPVSKKFSDRQKEVYEAVLDVNKKCIEYVKPGMMMSDLNKYARDLLAEKCIKLGLITDPKDVSNYYWHSVSHFLGLDVHDVGLYDKPVPAGTVLTIEPGLYIAEEAIGVRIEDDVLVTNTGSEVLSKDIMKEVADIEKYME